MPDGNFKDQAPGFSCYPFFFVFDFYFDVNLRLAHEKLLSDFSKNI